MSKNKKNGLDQYGTEHFGRPIFACHNQKSVELKGLTMIKSLPLCNKSVAAYILDFMFPKNYCYVNFSKPPYQTLPTSSRSGHSRISVQAFETWQLMVVVSRLVRSVTAELE